MAGALSAYGMAGNLPPNRPRSRPDYKGYAQTEVVPPNRRGEVCVGLVKGLARVGTVVSLASGAPVYQRGHAEGSSRQRGCCPVVWARRPVAPG